MCPFLSEKPVAAAAGQLQRVVDASEWSEASNAYGLAALLTLFPVVSSLRDWGIPIFGSKLNSAKQRALDACMGKKAEGTFVGRLRSLISTGELTNEEVAQFHATIAFAGYAPGHMAAWALYYLAQLPELQDSIVRELEQDQGEKSTWAQALWLETIRLYPLETHQYLTADTVTIAGRKVPAGTKVLIHMRHLLQNFHEPKLGEDLREFRPSRWIGPDGIHATPFNSLVFGHGARECVGRALAERFGPMVIASVVQRFVLSPDPFSEEKTFKDGPGSVGTPELKRANMRFQLRCTKGQALDECHGVSNHVNTFDPN